MKNLFGEEEAHVILKGGKIIKAPGLTKMLALDVATITGFCTRNASGTWNLTPKRDESRGMRLIRLKAKLKDVCAAEDVKIIVFERPAGFHKNALIVEAALVGVLELFCEENGIEYRAYSAKEIKKFGTGNGNASKEKMVEHSSKFKPGITDHNEADAVILYHLAKNDLGL